MTIHFGKEVTMTKSDLMKILALKANIKQKQSEQVINLIFDSMSETLEKGRRIELRGFGSFVSKYYPAYAGRNPRTGEVIQVPEKLSPFFKVAKGLQERVNGKNIVKK